MLKEDITKVIRRDVCDTRTFKDFACRLTEGDLTRDENPATHFCVYFLPFNKAKGEVFIVHHKKSGLWLSPGGHIDKGETLWQAVNREIGEELGVKNFFSKEPYPFLLTITPIETPNHPCKAHYDIWYLIETDGSSFNLDPAEFFAAKWLTIREARQIVVNKQNLKALDIVEGAFRQ